MVSSGWGYGVCKSPVARLCDCNHYNDVIMSAKASKITGVSIVYSTVVSDADERKHQSSVSLAFVRGIHRWPVNSPHKRPVTQKKFPFDDVIMPRKAQRASGHSHCSSTIQNSNVRWSESTQQLWSYTASTMSGHVHGRTHSLSHPPGQTNKYYL